MFSALNLVSQKSRYLLTASSRVAVFALVFMLLASCETKKMPTEGISEGEAVSASEQIEEVAAPILLPVDEKIVKGTLENGVQYIIRENSKPEKFAELRLIVKAGSVMEDESQLGFAHFAEHMAFNGTEDFKEQEIIDFVESIGMKFGAHLNASTTFDHTLYKLRVPTDDPTVIEEAIHILENWAHKITFENNAIDEERGVVLEEWRGRKGVGERIAKQQWPLMFAGTNYAERLPIGTPEIIQEGKFEDLKRFYTTWYRPELMSVVAVGDFDPQQIEALIKQYFSQIKSTDSTSSNEVPTAKTQYLEEFTQPQIKIIQDEELRTTTLSTSWRNNQAPLQQYTIDTHRQAVVKNLLSSILRKRINDKALDTSSPFLGARVSLSSMLPTAQELSFRAGIKPGQSEQAFESLLTEFFRMKEHGVSATELATEKRLYIEWFESSIESQNTLEHGNYIYHYVNHFLRKKPLTSIEQDFEITREILNNISAEDLKIMMSQLTDHDNVLVFLSSPKEKDKQEDLKASNAENTSNTAKVKDTPVSQQALLAIYDRVKNTPTQAMAEKEQVSELMDTIPAPGSIVQKTRIEKWDAHEWILSNGAKVIVKPTSFKENSIRFQAISNGGFATVDNDTYLQTFGMIDALSYLGLGGLNMEQLQQFSREKRFSLNPRVNEYSEAMSGSSNKEDLLYMMQSIYLRFTAPVKDEERFEWLKDNYRPQLENKYNSPNAQFFAAIQEKTSAGDPRRVEFDVDMLNKQDMDATFALYSERFANAADFTFFFVGDVDLPQMEDFVSTYIASLPSTDEREQRKALPRYQLKGEVEVHMEKGSEPKATVIYSLFGDATWSHQNQVVMSAFRSSLEKQLRLRLREELGAVYSVGLNTRLSRWPYQDYSLTVSFTCDPQRIDELYKEVNAIFAQFIEGDIDSQSLENFKTERLTNREKRLKENGFWMGYMGNHYTPFTPLPIGEYESLINSIDLDMLKAAAKQYLQTDNKVFATLKPSKEEPAKEEPTPE